MRDEFRPGALSARQARLLNDLLDDLERLRRLTAAPPLHVSRRAGIPILTVGELDGDHLGCPEGTEPVCAPPRTAPPFGGGFGSGSGSGSGSAGSGGGGGSSPDDGRPDDEYPGDGDDPVGVRDVLCILGTQYVTRGRLQVVSVEHRARLDWYELVTTKEGCCACGSGGSAAQPAGCCPAGHDSVVPVTIDGPFAAGCAIVSLVGSATYGAAAGAWEGTVSAGGVSAVVQLRCVGTAWKFAAVVTLADGTLLALSGWLSTVLDTLTRDFPLSLCAGAAVVRVGHPCRAIAGCDCVACPAGVAERYTFAVAGGTGSFAAADGAWTVVRGEDTSPDRCVWRGTLGDWSAVLRFTGDPVSGVQESVFLTDGASTLSYRSGVAGCCPTPGDPVLDGSSGSGVRPVLRDVRADTPCPGCTVAACGCAVPKTLYAHFAGSLAALGTLPLSWTGGTTWTSTNYTGCGNVPSDGVQFVCDGTNWRIPIAGAATVFQVAATAAGGCDPFSWTGSGTAVGTCAGAFSVVVNESPT